MQTHGRNHRLRHVQRAAQAHIENAVVICAGDVQCLHRLGDASVVHQYVDAAESRQRGSDRCLALRQIGHVGDQPQVLCAKLRRSLCRMGALQIQYRHFGTLRSHQLGCGKTQSIRTCATSDHCNFVL